MKENKWIDNNGVAKNKPKNNEICITKSMLGGYGQICIWNEEKESFNPIINGEIRKDTNLRDSARYWKKIIIK